MSHEVEHHVHESPLSMTGVLVVLAVLSAIGGFLSIPHFLEPLLPLPAVEPGLEHYETPWSALSIAIALRRASRRAAFFFGGGARARRARAPRASRAEPRALRQVLRRRALRGADRQAAAVDLGARLPAPRRPALFDGTLHGLAALGRRHRARARPHPDRQPAALRVPGARRHRRPRSRGACAMSDAALLNLVLFLPRRRHRGAARAAARARRPHPRDLVLGDGRCSSCSPRGSTRTSTRRSPACSSRRACRGSRAGASTTRSGSTATTCCWCCSPRSSGRWWSRAPSPRSPRT